MKAFITGVSGFVGPYLVKHLVDSGFEVSGMDRNGSRIDGCVVSVCDITDSAAVAAVVRRASPDLIFHLAGQSSVERSWKEPELTREVNVGGTKNLLDAVAAAGINPKILIVSSAEVYGIPDGVPITEEHPLKPVSPYGESRVAQEKIALGYFRSRALQVVISRSFNQTGPGQPPNFVCSDFARQIASIEKGAQPPVIKVGNLAVRRDFTDVRDAVRAYLLALQKGKAGEFYNVCSGEGHSVSSVLAMLLSFSAAASSAKQVKIVKASSRVRKSDIPELVGSPSKLMKATGWKPSIPFEKTLSGLLGYWRENA